MYIKVCFQMVLNCKISTSACHATTVKLFFASQLKKVRHMLLLSDTKRDDDDDDILLHIICLQPGILSGSESTTL